MRFFHKHEWKEVNRQFLQIKNNLGFQPDGPFTLITYQCLLCPKYQQKDLMGHIPSLEKIGKGAKSD